VGGGKRTRCGRRNLGIQAANTASVYPSIFAALGVWLAPEKKAKKQAATYPSFLPAGKRGSFLLPEGGPSEPQPGAAAAIDRLDEVDTGDGLLE
jgi:hypothetical protein